VENLKKYRIDVFNISNGEHEYIFDFDDDFFDNFENTPVTIGSGEVRVTLSKSETLLELSFDIKGKVQLICDRSLDGYDHQIDAQEQLMMKFGEEESEVTDEIIMIPWESNSINIGQFLYEFIGLSIPMKKLHPRFKHEDLDNCTNDENAFIYSSAPETETKSDGSVDPRWERLKELKTKKSKRKTRSNGTS